MTAHPMHSVVTGWRPSVLLVDDQPAKLLSYLAVLEGIEARLVGANSAREALEHLLRTDFAVVIVDVCMPELDGFELVATIREHPRFRQTAVIFVSGVHLSDFDRIRGYEHGAVDYLPVPIVPEILRAKVSVFLELARKNRELEQLNLDLERRVTARTAELENANRQKDEFLAVLAHELRNPLAAIRSAAHVLGLRNTSVSDSGRSVAVIERQVVQLARLIDDLVDVSRITRGIVELRKEPVMIADAVSVAVEASRPLIESRHHRLHIDVDSAPLVIDGDAMRLAQILTNILNNAAKFTEPGGDIWLSAGRKGDEVVMQVKDTGIGISPGMLSAVFDLFTQITPPLNRASSGLGIGLALVRRLVEMHGGQVSAESDGAGSGTEITVRLPLAMGPMDRAASIDGARKAVRDDALQFRVLVVDDNSDAADALATSLRLCGHSVLTADDGLEALRVGEAFRPDVVLLDLGMPRLNGYDAAREMRQQTWGRSAGLVAVTGWGENKDRHNTRHAGFDAHLVKPVSLDDVCGTLNRVVEAARRRERAKDRPQ